MNKLQIESKPQSRSVFEILDERGFIEQITHLDELKELFEKEKVSFYIGFDPTADSLHVGHFVSMMVASHMQKAGHTPIILIGGGTAMIGDPSGRTDMRQILTVQDIAYNVSRFKIQLSKFLSFEGDNAAIIVNNADWLLGLNYVEFIRDIGAHFSVNRMLSAECFKQRLEKGLSFLEFNYMLMQSYDFLELFRKYGCKLQLGGNDQWSNILGGVDLIRKVEVKPAFGLTFKLLTTSEGKKMGKTQKGALWLDSEKTTPYDFYQYWRNVDDADVKNTLCLLTFLPMDEVNRLGDLKDREINDAKKILAFEITKLIHGEDEALKAKEATEALFENRAGGAGASVGARAGAGADMPSTVMSLSDFTNGINVLDLLLQTTVIPSKSEGRRLMQQGGIFINCEKVDDFKLLITMNNFIDNELMIKKGKKVYHKVIIG
jgi:tyrosyl-tRNA synthetase